MNVRYPAGENTSRGYGVEDQPRAMQNSVTRVIFQMSNLSDGWQQVGRPAQVRGKDHQFCLFPIKKAHKQ